MMPDTSTPSTSKRTALPSGTKDAESKATKRKKRSNLSEEILPQEIKERKYTRADSWKLEHKQQLQKAFMQVIVDKNEFFSDDESLDAASKKIADAMEPSCRSNNMEVKFFILHYIRLITKHRILHDDPIDKWSELVEAISPSNLDLEQQLTSAMMVATEEPIPNLPTSKPAAQAVEKDGGSAEKDKVEQEMPEPDYNAIYKYLSSAMSGTPLPELSPIDSLVIEDCMQSLVEQIRTLDDGDLRLHLRRIYLYLHKVEDQSLEEDEDEITSQLNVSTLLNPLGINHNLIIPVPPK